MCFGCSKEPSHQNGSFEYPQHMFWLRNMENIFLLRTLIWGPIKQLGSRLGPTFRIWAQTVCKGCQQRIKVATARKEFNRSALEPSVKSGNLYMQYKPENFEHHISWRQVFVILGCLSSVCLSTIYLKYLLNDLSAITSAR